MRSSGQFEELELDPVGIESLQIAVGAVEILDPEAEMDDTDIAVATIEEPRFGSVCGGGARNPTRGRRPPPWETLRVRLDLDAVASFVALAESQHFGRAAPQLNVSVSALSKRIQRLEAALGVPLIERSSAGYGALTPAGRRFLEVAPALLDTADAARSAAAGESSSTLRVAIPDGVGVVAPLLPAALATLGLALRHTHPGVGVAAVPTPFARLTPDLVAGDSDIVLTFGASPLAEVVSTRLSPILRVGLVGANHPLARHRSMDVEDFARYPMIFSPELPDEYMLPFILADVRPVADAKLIPIAAENTAHVAHRILQGREVTVVPLALTANLGPELHRISLRRVPPTWYVAQRRADDDRAAVRTAVELMAAFTRSITDAAAVS